MSDRPNGVGSRQAFDELLAAEFGITLSREPQRRRKIACTKNECFTELSHYCPDLFCGDRIGPPQ